MFVMEHQLCTIYSGLSPIEVEHTPFIEVLRLYDCLVGYKEKESKEVKKEKNVRRKAGDNWY